MLTCLPSSVCNVFTVKRSLRPQLCFASICARRNILKLHQTTDYTTDFMLSTSWSLARTGKTLRMIVMRVTKTVVTSKCTRKQSYPASHREYTFTQLLDFNYR